MPRAEFEEKEFEHAANAELSQGGGFTMSAGQMLEAFVGYDAIASPVAGHVIWQVLNHPRPRGVRLLPNLWRSANRPPAGRLPQHPISLVVQYKRPEYLSGPRAAQWKFWRQPYFRFDRSEQQHTLLRRLDRELVGLAIVRYSSPAFWRYGELEASILSGSVLSRSGFVRPVDLRHHRVWTYIEPGTYGRANPSGRTLHFETIAELLRSITPTEAPYLPATRNGSIDRLAAHVAAVAEAARDRNPTLRRQVNAWSNSVRTRDLLLSDEGLVRISDLATVSSAIEGSTWLVTDGSDAISLLG